MATYEESVEEDLTCPICFELFIEPNIPKELDCPHILCQPCLEMMTDGWKPTVECPECRLVTKLSSEGLEGLKTNIRILSLAEKHFNHLQKRKNSAKEKRAIAEPDSSGVPMCPIHNGEKVHFYCTTCKLTACQACIVLKHEPRTRHDIKDVNEIYTEQQEEMKTLLMKAGRSVGQLEKAARDVEDQEENYKLLLMMEEQKIDTLVESVKEQGRVLKDEITKRSTKHLENFERHREELLQTMAAISSATTNVKKAQESTSCHDYASKHDQLTRELLKKIADRPQKFEEKYSEPEAIKFKSNPAGLNIGCLEPASHSSPVVNQQSSTQEQTLDLSAFVQEHRAELFNDRADRSPRPRERKLSRERRRSLTNATLPDVVIPQKIVPVSQNKLRKLSLIQEIKDCKRDLSGISVGQDGTLAVCSKYHGVIQTYVKDRLGQKYLKKMHFKLPVRAYGPQDVTVLPNGDHLVARMECVEIYDNAGVYKGDLQTGGEGSCGVVSVTSTPNKTVVVGDKDLQHITVQHSTDSKIFKIRKAPDRLTPIMNTQIAIASREIGVCIVDLKTGKPLRNMSIPKAFAICYDKRTNCLLVGRVNDMQQGNHKGVIEQYSCVNGEFIARIATGLIHPRAMTFLTDGLLAVADSNIVKIYTVV